MQDRWDRALLQGNGDRGYIGHMCVFYLTEFQLATVSKDWFFTDRVQDSCLRQFVAGKGHWFD